VQTLTVGNIPQISNYCWDQQTLLINVEVNLKECEISLYDIHISIHFQTLVCQTKKPPTSVGDATENERNDDEIMRFSVQAQAWPAPGIEPQ
jgi:hypothetical protein